jgi:hypothetical protein
MSDSKFVAHCASCGHAYKVPSDTKVYPCKECGGEVSADVEAPELDIDEEHLPKRRSIRERHPHESTTKVPMIVLGVLLVLGAIGAVGYVQNWFGFLTGAEPDFGKVTTTFVDEWNAKDLDAMAANYHPKGVEAFRTTLDLVAQHRGWEAGFPLVTSEAHKITKGTVADPKLGEIHFEFKGTGKGGDDLAGSGVASWQFEPSRDRWYMYDLKLVPWPLEPRVLDFVSAWGLSSLGELERFFKPKTKDEMVALVEKFGKKHGWLDRFPVLQKMSISGEEGAHSPIPSTKGVFSEHATAKKPLVVKWVFNRDLDQWVILGFKSFP